MTRKPLRCRFGFHSYIRRHPDGERPSSPDDKRNVLDRQRWTTREDLRLAIITWIEKTYHRRRRQRRLGQLSPIEFKTMAQAAHAA